MGVILKPAHFRSWSRPIRVLSEVPVSRNLYIYIKIIPKLIYARFGISCKQIRNQSWNDDIPEEPEKLRFSTRDNDTALSVEVLITWLRGINYTSIITIENEKFDSERMFKSYKYVDLFDQN